MVFLNSSPYDIKITLTVKYVSMFQDLFYRLMIFYEKKRKKIIVCVLGGGGERKRLLFTAYSQPLVMTDNKNYILLHDTNNKWYICALMLILHLCLSYSSCSWPTPFQRVLVTQPVHMGFIADIERCPCVPTGNTVKQAST